MWFFSRTDDLASLISAPAVIRNRFPAESYTVTVVLPTVQLVPRIQMDIMHFLRGFTVYELADLNIVGLCNSYLNTRAEIDMDGRYFVFF